MMNIENLIRLIKEGNRKPYLYHFTDTRNFKNIKKYGLRSHQQLGKFGVEEVIRGGNDWSTQQDKYKGLDDYVHLCYFHAHPMAYLIQKETRIKKIKFIKVVPEVLRVEGVLFTDGVSNASDSTPFNMDEVETKLDLEVLFEKTDWKDDLIKKRLRAAEKYEVLVPRHIPVELLR